MGEVYRARDTKLGRDVAIKALPAEVAHDAERLARFRREAHVLASLNHPGIAAIHGLEEDDGHIFLILELVEGETLGERIARGRVPLDEALAIARQIADALEEAHEHGIVHRDLKPANVKLTPDGKVKVLDFGLAKAYIGDSAASSADASHSPTLSRAGSELGVILGTAAYMSPEQARGKSVDKRADIWAFGVVLFEMLTGTHLFRGETVSDTLAGVLKTDPDWRLLPEETPERLLELLQRCLTRDPRDRLRDIGDARLLLVAIADKSPIQARNQTRMALWVALALLILAGAIPLLRGWAGRANGLGEGHVVRMQVPLPGRAPHFIDTPAISPDGTRIVYSSSQPNSPLYVRSLDRFEVSGLPGTEGGSSPFFSPDGQSVGFFAERRLKKVSLSSGAPVILCEANAGGATWGPDGTIVFSGSGSLLMLPAGGGAALPLTTLRDERGTSSHDWPEFLPDGQNVLFTTWTGRPWDEARIEAVSVKNGKRRLLVEGGTRARYARSGYLIFFRGGALMAAPFDPGSVSLLGPPEPVLDGVMSNISTGEAEFVVSNNGVLVYSEAAKSAADRTLVWADRQGRVEPLTTERRAFRLPSLSPDGRGLTIDILEPPLADVWLLNLDRGALTRLTFDNRSRSTIWSPDGQWLVFASSQGGPFNLFRRRADGSGPAERLSSSPFLQMPGAISPDGSLLAFMELRPDTGWDISVLALSERDHAARSVRRTPFNEAPGAFSPDGHWLVYESDEGSKGNGEYEVYVQAFPGPGPQIPVSVGGGDSPRWSRDGREIFYHSGDALRAVTVTAQPTFVVGQPKALLKGDYDWGSLGFNYSPAPDGRKFVMVKYPEGHGESAQVNVVLNWFEELKARVPASGRR